MTVKILKKDNIRVEDFDPSKIERALDLACDRARVHLTQQDYDNVEKYVRDKVEGSIVVPVDKIHGLVIDALTKVNDKVAKAYKDYRGYKQRFNKTFGKILDEETKLLSLGDKENANKNSELVSTKKELSSGIVSRHMFLDYEVPPEYSKAHKEGFIHNHDATDEIFGSINCCLFDMKNVLKDGYRLNGIDNTEPNHLETALDSISDIILSASSQQFGGFTVPEIDNVMAKYAEIGYNEYLNKFEHMSCAYASREKYEEWVKNFVIGIIEHAFENKFDHRLNTINNSNGQTSFTTISFGLDTSEWGREISKAILKARLKGLGVRKVSAIFPKLVFLHRADINGNEDSPNYDIKELAINCSMLRMYPDWLSLDSGYLGDIYDKYGLAISPMGCRAFLSPWYKRGGMYPADENDEPIYIGRANCGAVSLNLPRFALESKGDINKFYSILDYYFDLAVKKHIYKFNKLRGVKASSNPLFFCEGGCHIKLDYNDTIEEAIKTFTWSIGYIGLDEVTRYFNNGIGIDQDNTLATEILRYIQNKIEVAKKETGLLLALYSTPAESLCYRFLELDKSKYGIVPYVTDKEYYTNSYHVDVRVQIEAVDKQIQEAPMFHIATGGRIVYNEFPQTHNKLGVTQCINHAMKLGLYYGINLQLDTCLDCGHTGEFPDKKCTHCGGTNIISINRTCGYLGYTIINGDTRMNAGKDAEIKKRVDHFN